MRVENEVHMQPEGQEGFPAAIQTLDLKYVIVSQSNDNCLQI